MFQGYDALTGRRVLIVGFARQGQAVARWLPTVGARALVTDDKTAEQLGVNPDEWPGVRFALGGTDVDMLRRADVLCISGGVPINALIVQAARDARMPVVNDAQLFLERCPAPVVGITGSAGKTTTTTLVGAMLKAAGLTTWVGGNIGNVLLDVVMGIRADHVVVMELSSFQLEVMNASPPIAGVTNITPNHLDRHGTMQAYLEAKARLLAFQDADNMAVLNADDSGSRVLEQVVRGDLWWFSRHTLVTDGACLVGERLVLTGAAAADGGAKTVCSRHDLRLRGDHNISNALAACALAAAAGVGPEPMAEVLTSFTGVPHRLELVRELDGVQYVNDSIATAPERVLAALHSYTEPLVLLLGGTDKKLPWNDMLALALVKSRRIVAFGGDAADIVVRVARELGAPPDLITRVGTLEEAVAAAHRAAQPGDVVLLSPGGTSFDAYADFAARGDHFRTLVQSL